MVAKHADKLTCFELWGTRHRPLDNNYLSQFNYDQNHVDYIISNYTYDNYW